MSDNRKHRMGYSSKLSAMKYFVDKEYFVFNETNTGPIDFIAVNSEGDIKLIECKTISRRSDGSKISRVLSNKQRELNKKLGSLKIQLVYVDSETNEVWT